MIVIANKTETKLLKDLKNCVRESPAQKCFYMEFSKCDVPKEKLFETFLRVLEELPNSYMAQAYLCQDKDIFILMQGFMQRHFLEFIKRLAGELDAKEIVDLIDIFEIGTHWDKLSKLCNDKITAIDTEEERVIEEKRKAAADIATLEVFKKLDSHMISTIALRRSTREDISVLVVDDDQLARTLVGNVLKQDYHVAYAHNGTEAIEGYLKEAPDVVFLDIGMPDISGHEVLECLFQMDIEPYVIMFSGRKDKENMMKALDAGAQGFVGKPFTREKLFEYIQKSPYVTEKNRVPSRHKAS